MGTGFIFAKTVTPYTTFCFTVMSPEIRTKKGAKSGGRVAESVR